MTEDREKRQSQMFPEVYTIPPGARTKRCSAPDCRARIYLIKTPSAWMPVNPDGTPHWATCTDPDAFRKRPR